MIRPSAWDTTSAHRASANLGKQCRDCRTYIHRPMQQRGRPSTAEAHDAESQHAQSSYIIPPCTWRRQPHQPPIHSCRATRPSQKIQICLCRRTVRNDATMTVLALVRTTHRTIRSVLERHANTDHQKDCKKNRIGNIAGNGYTAV